MINTAEVTAAIVAQLEQHARMEPFKDITRGSYVNEDPALCPWVGVYCSDMSVEPRTLGNGGKNWASKMTIRVIVQAHSALSSQASEDALGDAVDRTIDAMMSDMTFGNIIDATTGYEMDFSFKETKSETLEFRHAIISFTVEVRST